MTSVRLIDRTVWDDLIDVLPLLPESFVDLLIVDPPYNISKTFNSVSFSATSIEEYAAWFSSWFVPLMRTLKPTASVYICSEWRTSPVVFDVASQYLNVRNRITWEREKGRGASRNWKNCSEDVWFCTVSDDYVFNVDAVKLRRRVVAPYRDSTGRPKDWTESEKGNYRVTHPSNVWTDITVPFWSMPENTDHPTQKPEKLVAKLVLASSNEGDVVLDPFLGSGTSSVVAKKLGRRYVGIEKDLSYCCLAEKRLDLAAGDRRIQGYEDGLFWERNSTLEQIRTQSERPAALAQDLLFGRQG
jgi:site-specific DNA-methyltransferase (adenine-specific)